MNKFLGFFFLALFLISCSGDLDFDQAKDLKLEPIAVANLASFDIKANQFIVGGVELPLEGDVINFTVFSEPEFNSNIKRTDFISEFTNTINRAFTVKFDLLDANNKKLYTISYDMPASSGTPILVSKTEIFENANLDILKQTKKIAFTIFLLPGPTLSESSLGSLKLRSSGTLYFRVQ